MATDNEQFLKEGVIKVIPHYKKDKDSAKILEVIVNKEVKEDYPIKHHYYGVFVY